MMKLKNYVLWLVLILFLSGCASSPGIITLEADTDGAIITSGTMRAKEVYIASEFGGKVASIDVKVGEHVLQGDILVHLDSTPWELELGPKESAIRVTEADLNLLLAGPHPAEIDAARGALVLANAQYNAAVRGWERAADVAESPQDIMAQIIATQTQVNLAAQGVELAEAELNQARMSAGIYEKGSIQRDAADLQVRAAEESLAAAQADEHTAQVMLGQLWALYNNPLGYIAQANAAEHQVKIMEAGVAVAQAQLDQKLAGASAEEIALVEASVRRAEAEANLLRLKIERSTLSSPIDAVVVSQVTNQGELVAPAGTILVLADLENVILDVYVSEGRIGQVALGQEVKVTTDSFPDRVFTGYVSKIADEPEFTPRNVATAEERMNTFYAVSIRLENAEHLLKPGMPADAEF